MTEIPARLSVVTGRGNPIGWSGFTFACTVDTRDGVGQGLCRGRLRWRNPGGRRDRPVVGGRALCADPILTRTLAQYLLYK